MQYRGESVRNSLDPDTGLHDYKRPYELGDRTRPAWLTAYMARASSRREAVRRSWTRRTTGIGPMLRHKSVTVTDLKRTKS